MIRPIVPADTPAVVALCASTGLFEPPQLEVLRALLVGYPEAARNGHQALVYEADEAPVGVVYLLPRDMTDRTWEVLMIMVDAARQGAGIGSALMAAAEAAARDVGGRLLLVETSATDDFERTRRFYEHRGFAEVARVPDYYADGAGKATLTKRLSPPA